MDEDEAHRSNLEVRRLYAQYEEELSRKRRKLENPDEDPESFDAIVAQVQNLYNAHVSHTKNARVVDMDQRAFRETAEIMLERMRNQVRNESSDMSIRTMVNALKDRAETARSGTAVLAKMGSYWFRGSQTATVSGSLPTLDRVVRREIHRGTRQRSDRPQGPVEEAMDTNEDELESEADKIFKLTQTKILAAIVGFGSTHPGEDLQLYRLVFDKYNFVRTLENFFAVSVMVKERKLWLGADRAGLPIVSINEETSDSQSSEGRHQFNLNFNAEVYGLQMSAYGDQEPMIVRSEYDDEM